MVSDYTVKIINMKIQTELIRIMWKLAEKGEGGQVSKAVSGRSSKDTESKYNTLV